MYEMHLNSIMVWRPWFQMVTSTTAALSSSSFRISCIVRPQTWLLPGIGVQSRNSFLQISSEAETVNTEARQKVLWSLFSNNASGPLEPQIQNLAISAGMSHVSDLSSLCLASHDLCEGAATEPPSTFYIYQYPAVINNFPLIFTHL